MRKVVKYIWIWIFQKCIHFIFYFRSHRETVAFLDHLVKRWVDIRDYNYNTIQ